MSSVDQLLARTGSEFEQAAEQLPTRSSPTRATRRSFPNPYTKILAVTLAVAALAVPAVLLFGGGSVAPALQSPADVVFEGDGWILGVHEEPLGEDEYDFCWEFAAPGRGVDGVDVTEVGCDERTTPTEGGTGHFGGVFIELEDVNLSVYEISPGDGGQVEVRTGRDSVRYEGKRMPLSGTDVFVLEFDPDAASHSIRPIPPWAPDN